MSEKEQYVAWLHPAGTIRLDEHLVQRFSIPVLAPPPPLSAYLKIYLSQHLIHIISLLEVRFVHELCSDWHAPYTEFIAPYSMSRWNPLKFTSLRNFHSWICTAQHIHARTSVTSYTSVNIYNLNSHLAHFNALWMDAHYKFASNWNHVGISCDVHFAGHLRSNRTNFWSNKSNIRNVQSGGGWGARTGIENRWSSETDKNQPAQEPRTHSPSWLAACLLSLSRSLAFCLWLR